MGIFSSLFESKIPVYKAAMEGDISNIQRAIERNDPELDSTQAMNYTPLYITLISNNSLKNPGGRYDECTLALLEAGCSTTRKQGKEREHILSTFASNHIDPSIVRLLVSYGATHKKVCSSRLKNMMLELI